MRSSCSGKTIYYGFIVKHCTMCSQTYLLIIQFSKAEFNCEKNISSCSYLL